MACIANQVIAPTLSCLKLKQDLHLQSACERTGRLDYAIRSARALIVCKGLDNRARCDFNLLRVDSATFAIFCCI